MHHVASEAKGDPSAAGVVWVVSGLGVAVQVGGQGQSSLPQQSERQALKPGVTPSDGGPRTCLATARSVGLLGGGKVEQS